MSNMKLRKVYLNADVYAVCLQHALSTEKEEVMGLLIGQVDEINRTSHIHSCIILRRSDKQPDRVEISPEQLIAATKTVENLSLKLKTPLRVNGWYHSHPHITVWSSRVDVRTQSVYQTLDNNFFGLIFSVFPNETRNNDNFSKENEIQVICFQSEGADHYEVPLFIKYDGFKPFNYQMMAELPKILREEEQETAEPYLNELANVDPLNVFHNMAYKLAGMVHMTDKIARPIFEAANARHENNLQRIKYLEQEIIKINLELTELKNDIIVID